MGDYYDRAGRPIALLEWARMFEGEDDRHVALDSFDGVEVSTVWLGIDHRFGRPGPPLIFETMVFGGDHDGYTWRTATEAEAIVAHAEAVAIVRRD